MICFTSKYASNKYLLYTCVLDFCSCLVCYELVCLCKHHRISFFILKEWVKDIVYRESTGNLTLESFVLGSIGRYPNTIDCMTIFHCDDDILSHIYKLSCKISGTSCLEGSICKTLSC